MKIFIIPTSSTRHLAKTINKKKPRGVFVIFPQENKIGSRFFPDGEIHMKLPLKPFLKTRGYRAIILHSGYPDPNAGLIELELIVQIIKDKNIKKELFFSYFPYGMQDMIFERGETNAAENLVKKFVNYYGTKKIFIIDPHFAKRPWVKKYPIKEISAVPFLIKNAKKYFGENILLLSPDIGGKRRTGILGMSKKRLTPQKVKISLPKISLKGKIIGVVDDVIKTGGTLLKCYDIVKKLGAKKVIALITHGVISVGIRNIKNKYSKLYLTNTISQKEANVNIADLILKNILA